MNIEDTSRLWVRVARALALLTVAWVISLEAHSAPATYGHVLTRTYPLEGIGNATRGAHLSFDPNGRVAVIGDGSFTVLNDTLWTDLAEPSEASSVRIVNAVKGPNGALYFGGVGAWGEVNANAQGRLHPTPFSAEGAPAWVGTTTFMSIEPTAEGVYFAGWKGAIYWHRATGQSDFYEAEGLTALIRIEDQIFIASYGRPLLHFDGPAKRVEPLPPLSSGGGGILAAARLDERRALLALRDGGLVTFDGKKVEPWRIQASEELNGRVSCLLPLPEGNLAIAVTGKGLFFVAPGGGIVRAVTSPSFHRINRLASREPGVLWVMTEDSVEKVLYGNPLHVFGQRVGLPLSWPLVAQNADRVFVSTEGRLYGASSGSLLHPSQFELLPQQPSGGAWALASNGESLLVGNGNGVWALQEGDRFEPVLRGLSVSFLAQVGKDLCFAIGPQQVAALRWNEGRWQECAEPIASLANPSVVHAGARGVWIEYGQDRVGWLRLRDGKIEFRLFNEPQWKNAAWVNVGLVDGVAVLSASNSPRLYFDESTNRFVSAPAEVALLLAKSPFTIIRIQKDDTGTLWGTHRNGVVALSPTLQGYELDIVSFNNISDLFPRVQILQGRDIWFSGPRSLYRVDPDHWKRMPRTIVPRLLSVIDARTSEELFSPGRNEEVPEYRYRQNSLQFWFFSNTYAWLTAPQYEFRLNPDQPWARLPPGSPLNLSGLREGAYALEVRLRSGQSDAGDSAVFSFTILPPWFRTPLAFAAYLSGIVLALGLIVWGAGRRVRRHNVELEDLVRVRTAELEETMAKLNDETRAAATLAERNRLAGEIHDSLQQGLCGAILQLDATIGHPQVKGQLQSRLVTVRNMISFTRQEVQNAIWDLESPMLVGADLSLALRELVGLINPGTLEVKLQVGGNPIPLPSEVQHHLLRIAQEATTNAVRHAAARQIDISLIYAKDLVSLSVADDGVGFNPAAVQDNRGGHFGLRGMQTRASKLRGTLLLESSPGQGALVRITVPLHETPGNV